MKNNWQTKKLGEVCEIIKGRKPALKEKPLKNDLPYLVAKFLRGSKEAEYASTGDRNSIVVKENEIIIICDGSNSGEIFLGFNGILSSTMGKITHSKGIDTGYLKLFLGATFSFFNGVKTGAAIPHLDKDALYALEIPLPPLPEQKRIVKILDEAFGVIFKAKENTEKNLQNARELFESYLLSIFANPGEDWMEKNLGECFKLRSGDNITSKMMNENGKFPVYGGNGIVGRYDKYNLSGSNIIIGRVGALCGNVRHIKEEIWLTDNAFKVTDWKYDFDHAFLTYLLNFKNLRSYARQAAQPVISNSSLESLVLQFPKSISEQKNIVSKLDSLSFETKKLEGIYQQKLSDLDELRKSILQKAFNGELAGA